MEGWQAINPPYNNIAKAGMNRFENKSSDKSTYLLKMKINH
jgi:hypothetical protein